MLGDHLSFLLIGLTPLYWLWSDPRMLLIAQAILIAASIVPVFLFAQPRLGRPGAYALCLAYSIFWAINAAIGFQFHELAFSPLLVALTILFADRRQWPAFFVSLALLLLVKENMSVLAVFIGLWLISGREYRLGAITIGAGVLWYLLALNVLLPPLRRPRLHPLDLHGARPGCGRRPEDGHHPPRQAVSAAVR